MAYLIKPEDEAQQSGQLGQVQTSQQSSALTPGTEAGSAPDQKVQQGSGWTNLSQYLDVNKGQATGLANDLTKDVNSKVDSFKSTDASGAVAEINKQNGDDSAKTITSNVAANAPAAKTFLGQQVNVNPNDYTANVKATSGQLKDTLGQVDNQQFQQGQLQKIYKDKPNYTSGFGALDSFLLFGDQDSKGKLQQVKARTGEVDNKVASFGGEIDNAIGSAKAQLAKNQGAVREAAKGQYSTILGTAGGRVDGAKSAAKTAAETKAAQIFAKKKGEYAGFINDGADGDEGFKFVKNNDKFGVNNVLTDDEVTQLNTLAGLDSGLGLGAVTKDDSQAVTLDEGGWESLLNSMGSSRKAAKEEADRKAAAEEAARKAAAAEAKRLADEAAEAKRLQKILDDNAAIERQKAEAAAAKERERVGSAFSQAYSMPEGYNPNPPPPPPPTNTKSKEQVVGTDISDAGKQIAAAPGDLFNTINQSVQSSTPAKKANATINNAKKGKVKF
jgi:hypothetical protein